jgi:hypothetical protein
MLPMFHAEDIQTLPVFMQKLAGITGSMLVNTTSTGIDLTINKIVGLIEYIF